MELDSGCGELGAGGDPGSGISKVGKELVAVVFIDEFVSFFS